MQRILYWFALGLVRGLQALPLPCVAWLGRRAGALAYWVDVPHRRTALRNLQMCFGTELAPAQRRALARENFRRLGENYCAAIKTAVLSWEQLQGKVEFAEVDQLTQLLRERASQNFIVAIGHFGNFELYARFGQAVPGVQCATTYRALKQPLLNRLMQSLRATSGCQFFERRTEAEALKAALGRGKMLLGLLSDQHAGQGGVRVPFLGQECSTSAAPAVLALRYGCALFTGVCYRIGLGRWRIEAGPEIPTHADGHPRSVEAITTDINRALEKAVRRDPANWFWVHKRWKPGRVRRAARSSVVAAGDAADAGATSGAVAAERAK